MSGGDSPFDAEPLQIDRFEDGWAILLVGDDEWQIEIPQEELPQGSREGHWLRVGLCGERIISIEIDEGETARAKERIAARLAQLRNRGRQKR